MTKRVKWAYWLASKGVICAAFFGSFVGGYFVGYQEGLQNLNDIPPDAPPAGSQLPETPEYLEKTWPDEPG